MQSCGPPGTEFETKRENLKKRAELQKLVSESHPGAWPAGWF